MATATPKKKLGKARHLSAYTRERQNVTRYERNRSAKSSLRTEIKKARTDKTKTILATTITAIDKAASKGLIPKQRASRLVSRLTKMVNAAQ